MRGCNIQFVKIRMRKVWAGNKVEEKKNTLPAVTSAARNRVNVVLQADGDHGFLHEWCKKKKAETKLKKRRTCYWTHTVKCKKLLILCVFCKKNNCSESLLQPTKSIVIVDQKGKRNSRSWLEIEKKNCEVALVIRLNDSKQTFKAGIMSGLRRLFQLATERNSLTWMEMY